MKEKSNYFYLDKEIPVGEKGNKKK